jgi:nicotinamidase-related amidase
MTASIDQRKGTVMTSEPLGPNTSLIPPLGAGWQSLDMVDALSQPTAFVSISQVNSLYSPDGAQADERQWERGTLENTIRVAGAARELGAYFFWVGYDIFRAGYPKTPMDASQYGSWEEPFADWDEARREWDGELASELKSLVRPGDVPMKEIAHQSSFIGTNLEWHLRRNNVRTIVFTGMHLDWCIEGNARQARDLGYMPIVVGDATACERREDEAAAMRRINNYFAPVISTDDVVKLMAGARQRNKKEA